MDDWSFSVNEKGLRQALRALVVLDNAQESDALPLPGQLPETGVGEHKAIAELAPLILGKACHLGSATAFAHMDPPTPWITWATTMWNAALNQNLLHPDVAPVARDVEASVVSWLAPFFGMTGGHMTPGSTVANLTALWAAREIQGIKRVVASEAAHISVAKAAHLLGLEFRPVACDSQGRLDHDCLPGSLGDAAVVLTAGTTSCGAIDRMTSTFDASWLHIDAAWAGPLKLSDSFGSILEGIESADSVAVSAHKWMFQPKDSGLLFFRDAATAHQAVSFGAEYLAVPNIGLLGSHGANAVPLLATLLSWGRVGLVERIDRAMELANELHGFLATNKEVEVFGPNRSGVLLWRAKNNTNPQIIVAEMPPGTASTTSVGGRGWVRHVAANPNADAGAIKAAIKAALRAIS